MSPAGNFCPDRAEFCREGTACFQTFAQSLPSNQWRRRIKRGLRLPPEPLQAGYLGMLVSAITIVIFNRCISLLGARDTTAIIALLRAVPSTLPNPRRGPDTC
jgi:hypothetical protein